IGTPGPTDGANVEAYLHGPLGLGQRASNVIYVTLDDDVELLEVGSGRSSSPNDAVVAIFIGEKGDGLVPFFATGKEVAANSSVV
nr:hypothetical protein [Tanacetum cinerariifolium]